MLFGMIVFFFFRTKIQRALIDRSLEGKAQIQTAGAGRGSSSAAGLGPRALLGRRCSR